jgi:hypothetical protein
MMKARYVRIVVSGAVAAVVVIFGCALLSSVVIQSFLILGTFSIGSILGGFGSMSSALLVTVEGGLVFLMVSGGAKVVLSQKLVRFTSYPKLSASPKLVSRPLTVGGNYRGGRQVARPSHAGVRVSDRAYSRVIRASP